MSLEVPLPTVARPTQLPPQEQPWPINGADSNKGKGRALVEAMPAVICDSKVQDRFVESVGTSQVLQLQWGFL